MCGIDISIGLPKILTNKDHFAFYQKQSESIKSDCKLFNKILKQHKVDSISYAGDSWYDKFGNLVKDFEINKDEKIKELFKFEISYTALNGSKHTWCFN